MNHTTLGTILWRPHPRHVALTLVVLVACTTITLLADASPASAQAPVTLETSEAGGASVRVPMGEVVVTPADHTAAMEIKKDARTLWDVDRRDGVLQRAIRSEAVRLAQSPAVAPNTNESWAVRHPVLLGTLIGAGAGLIIEEKGCGLSDCYGFIAGAVTAGGAYGGLIASAIHKAKLKQHVSTGTKAGIVAGTVVAILVASVFVSGSYSN